MLIFLFKNEYLIKIFEQIMISDKNFAKKLELISKLT